MPELSEREVNAALCLGELQGMLRRWASRAPSHPLLDSAQRVVDLATRCAPQQRPAALTEAAFLLQVVPEEETDALHLDLAIIYHVVTLLTDRQTLDCIIIPVYDAGPKRAWGHHERHLPYQGAGYPKGFKEAAEHHLHVVSMLLTGAGSQHVRIKLSSAVNLLFHTLILRSEAVLDVLFEN
ncbi:hypothetical protein GCM10008959_23230 [Deinococcus seoulensis]|uniref:Uncharacterized protein n=2 Tax=Deinococcus seoulensis TaxID=1837379 RepID=A0ABQ2RVJ7_9DEIO|nr:hypothetical protein GCM10008959_23230 [Deinococcus seoulensis]